MQRRSQEPRRRNKQQQQPENNASAVSSDASTTYTTNAEEMLQQFDAAIAALVSDPAQAAGPSLSLGQQVAQGVMKPTPQASATAQPLSNETFVQNFRQTSGE